MDGFKSHPLSQSIGCALFGILSAIKGERNIKIEICFACLAIIFGLMFGITQTEWLAVVIMIFSVIAAEIFNSAIEETCNCERDGMHLAYGDTKMARDLSAGAVLLLSMGSVVVGLIIYLPYVFRLLQYHQVIK